MKRRIKSVFAMGVVGVFFMVGPISSALAIDIQGQISKQKQLVTGMSISTKVKTLMKIKFAGFQLPAGQSLTLCAGTMKDFQVGDCPLILSTISADEGPYLSIIDTSQVLGKDLYILCDGSA
jgi:hypothetical protein